MNLNSEFKKALGFHRRGDLDTAGALYESLLKAAPDQASIWHLAGVLSHQNGDLEKAGHQIATAVSISPGVAEYLISLGVVLKADGKMTRARKILEKASCLAPGDTELISELGDLANAMGDYRQAADYFRQVVSKMPNAADGHFNLGLAERNRGNPGAALISFKQAIHLDPGLKEAHYAIGNLMLDRGDFLTAIACYKRVLGLDPEFFQAHYNMGNAARSAGNSVMAAECYRKALELRPDYSEAHNNMGLLLKDNGQYSEAISYFETAARLKPELAEATYNIGVVEQLRGNHDTGLNWFQKTLQTRPDYAPARWMWHLSLPIIYRDRKEIDRYRQRFERNLTLLVDHTPLGTPEEAASAVEGVGSMTNFYLQYQACNDRELQMRYGEFVCRLMKSAYPQWCDVKPKPPCPEGAKIRLGYVSSFMRAHTVGEFLAGWLEHHDQERFEIYCYHIGDETDPMTRRFRNHTAAFHQIGGDLEKAATTILDDHLHILVFTDIGMNPLATQLAAMRLAPVQCKGWGHPVTTGLPTIDYYLSSDLMEPENGQRHYSERLIRLPNLALAYSPPALPEKPRSRSDFGLPENAFLCLNTQSLFKLLPQHDDIYPRIASEAPEVKFVFLAHKDTEITRQFTERLANAFTEYDLSFAEHCHILPRQSFPDFLSLNLAGDLLLDSLEWSGGKTTLEAISCGLPVVTCPGDMMRGRHAYAMLRMMGIDATIAGNKKDYIQIVVRLCRDSGFYGTVKRQINSRKSKLYADREFIDSLENFYRAACRDGEPIVL